MAEFSNDHEDDEGYMVWRKAIIFATLSEMKHLGIPKMFKPTSYSKNGKTLESEVHLYPKGCSLA